MNATYLIIRNRTPLEPSSGWIHIVPKGELPNGEAGVVQVLDDAALDAILGRIEKDKTRLGNRWPGIYAGEEHFIYDDTKSSAAFAWFKDFQKREDGIWASESGLTDLGVEAVKNRRFKFTSFVADRKQTERLDDKRVRIVGIETVGFTNFANGRELLTPIRNRGEEFRRGLGATAGSEQTTKGTHRMKSVATKLGLSADASEEAVLAEVTKFMNRATELDGQVKPLQTRVSALETENTQLLADQIMADFAAAGIKDEKIVNRHKGLLGDPKHFKNREERVAFIKDLTAGRGASVEGREQKKLHNRETKPPSDQATDDGGAGERVKAGKIMNRAIALQKEHGCSLATAVTMAQNEGEES